MKGLKRPAVVLVVLIIVGLLWYQAFALTGVTAPVVPAGAKRPPPPRPPRLSPLSLQQADIELFRQSHPVWSAL